MLKVGLTGGIGTGKSTIAELFSMIGIPIYEADKRAKWLLNNEPSLINQIKELMGEQAYEAGSYHAKWVAKKVFQNNGLLQKLNAIVHPAVGKDWILWCQKYKHLPYVMKEAAIMKKEGLDFIINVKAPKEVRIERVLKRDTHRTRADILNVIALQSSESYFEEISDFEVQNGNDELVISQVLNIHQKIISTLE